MTTRTPFSRGQQQIIGQLTNRAILIKVHNAAALARSQGAAASLVQAIAPATIEAEVYKKVAEKLAAALRENNVDADVQVVEPKAFQPADGKHIATDIVIGAAAIGGIIAVLAFGRKLIAGRSKRKVHLLPARRMHALKGRSSSPWERLEARKHMVRSR